MQAEMNYRAGVAWASGDCERRREKETGREGKWEGRRERGENRYVAMYRQERATSRSVGSSQELREGNKSNPKTTTKTSKLTFTSVRTWVERFVLLARGSPVLLQCSQGGSPVGIPPERSQISRSRPLQGQAILFSSTQARKQGIKEARKQGSNIAQKQQMKKRPGMKQQAKRSRKPILVRAS